MGKCIKRRKRRIYLQKIKWAELIEKSWFCLFAKVIMASIYKIKLYLAKFPFKPIISSIFVWNKVKLKF